MCFLWAVTGSAVVLSAEPGSFTEEQLCSLCPHHSSVTTAHKNIPVWLTLSMSARTVSPVSECPGKGHSSTLNSGTLWHMVVCLLRTHTKTSVSQTVTVSDTASLLGSARSLWLDLSSCRVHSSLVIVTELQTPTHESLMGSAGDSYQLLSEQLRRG